MALRIIRKSASQSQVELIKGQSEGRPALSLLCCFDSPESLAAVQALVQQPWIQEHAECVLLKAHGYSENVRSQFSAQAHAIKLLTEPAEASWSLRLRNLVQEASSEIVVFVPQTLTGDVVPLIQKLVSHLHNDPIAGMAAPALAHNEHLLAAGHDTGHGLPAHTLAIGEQSWEYAPAAKALFYLYRDLPLNHWQQLAPVPLQVPALPLQLVALRREAYLSLAWANQDFDLPWLGQDLAQGLRQKQYRLLVIPETLALTEAEAQGLQATDMPEAFREKWGSVLRDVSLGLYRHHGWQQHDLCFSNPVPGSEARLQSHFAEKVESA
ncbi:MAG: hypothetical protein ACO1RX_20360 [Candidatus Sericytochromatia bacterium]